MIRALSILQPWAWLIVSGHKGIENRSWSAPSWQIGKRLVVHASARLSAEEYASARLISDRLAIELPPPDELALGAALGTVLLDTVVEQSADPWFFGPFGWVVHSPIRFAAPIPVKGALGLWKYPLDLPAVSI